MTEYNIHLQLRLPELTPSHKIIGRELHLALKLDILFATKQFKWDGLSIQMRTKNSDLGTRIKNIYNPLYMISLICTPTSKNLHI
jgi:hypothetical protein